MLQLEIFSPRLLSHPGVLSLLLALWYLIYTYALGKSTTIDQCRTFSTSHALQSEDEELVKIGFVGAGGVSFGTKEGPWNHSVRLERMPNVQFTAIVDPDLELAKVNALLRLSIKGIQDVAMYSRGIIEMACAEKGEGA